MKIGIYDVDKTGFPNLALMKISAYHKSMGHDVEMYQPLFLDEYDKIYASKVFDFSDGSMLIPDRMEIGGTGYDMSKSLPPEIESFDPDYAIYNYPHNIGFSMRGCRLKCSFCVVPEKEGGAKNNDSISKIWTQRTSNFVVLLDNDFFGNPSWRDKINEINELGLKVCFSQGLNIRNIKPEQAAALASVKFRNLKDTAKQVYFAWDDPRHEKLIHKGIKTCLDAGIKPSQMAFFVLIGYHSTEQEDLRRVQVLLDYGCDPFAMPYDRKDDYQRRFARWVNHKAILKSVPWNEYSSGVKKQVMCEDQQVLNFV